MAKLTKFTELQGRFQDYLNPIKKWLKDKQEILSKYINTKKKFIIAVGTAGLILIGVSFGILHYQANAVTLYHVYVDGEKIGTVDDKSVVDTWMSQRLREAEQQYDSIALDTKNNITFEKEVKYKGSFDNLKMIDALKDKIEIRAKGVEIVVNGKVVGIIKDQATADRLIISIKQAYMPKSEKNRVSVAEVNAANEQNVNIESIEIKETVETKETVTFPNEILSEDDMFNLLKLGTLEEKKYTVKKGDTISEIAAKFSLSSEQVYQLNPNLSGELIHIDDELTVTAMTPLVTVKTIEKVNQTERIPYSVVYQKDDSMYVNETKIYRAGKEGKKEVDYSIIKENGIIIQKTILNEKILENPIDKIISKGTKIIPSRGSGTLSWPTAGGIITSYFGPRWGTVHQGLDIARVSDYTIKAADNGNVIFAGWKGGYGKAVMIDHGNGIVTLYGHLSSISVSDGDKVGKGQKIGIMGSTGNSTGIHLHFEVRVNGTPKNPLNYVGI